MRIPRVILYFLIGVFAAHFIFYYPNLPEVMATHFNAAGEPDGWMSKQNSLIFEVVLLFIIISEFTFLPLLIEKMPDTLINLPNKEFWLAAERRAETFDVMRAFFEWFAVALLTLLIVVNHFIFTANLKRENLPASAMWLIVGTFLIFTIAWMIKFLRHFKIKR